MGESTKVAYEKILKNYVYDETTPEEIIKNITDKSPTYKKMIICAYLYKYRKTHEEDEITVKYKEIIKKLKEKTEEKEKSRTNKFAKIDLNKIRESIKEDEYDIKNVIRGLYTIQIPRRVKDYSQMRYVKTRGVMNDIKYNYYIGDESKFYFQVYKTVKKHGIQEIEVKEPLNKIIKGYIQTKGIKENTALLKYTNGTKDTYPESTLRMYIQEIFKGSVNSIRHAYVTELYGHIPEIWDIDTIAEKMGHSGGNHLKYLDKENIKVI